MKKIVSYIQHTEGGSWLNIPLSADGFHVHACSLLRYGLDLELTGTLDLERKFPRLIWFER